MSDVDSLVKKALEEINNNKQTDVENKVKKLVNSILFAESKIKEMQNEIALCKKELKELQLPEKISVEV
jgi:peptidoglycan hydrolase CwlO-like protein